MKQQTIDTQTVKSYLIGYGFTIPVTSSEMPPRCFALLDKCTNKITCMCFYLWSAVVSVKG